LNKIPKLTIVGPRTIMAHIFFARFTTDEIKLVLTSKTILFDNSWVPITWG
jgi:hypothetical protein